MKGTKKEYMKALEKSIENWWNVHDDPLNTPVGRKDRALCRLSYNVAGDHCRLCPVYWGTGEALCKKTPYWDFVRLKEEMTENIKNITPDSIRSLQSMAMEMAEFLNERVREEIDKTFKTEEAGEKDASVRDTDADHIPETRFHVCEKVSTKGDTEDNSKPYTRIFVVHGDGVVSKKFNALDIEFGEVGTILYFKFDEEKVLEVKAPRIYEKDSLCITGLAGLIFKKEENNEGETK